LQEIHPSQTRKRGPDPTGTFQSRKSPRFSASTGDLATHVHFEDSILPENDDRFEDLEEQDEEEFIEFPIEPSKPKVGSDTVSTTLISNRNLEPQQQRQRRRQSQVFLLFVLGISRNVKIYMSPIIIHLMIKATIPSRSILFVSSL
jgi:hypothetical protein